MSVLLLLEKSDALDVELRLAIEQNAFRDPDEQRLGRCERA